MRKEKRELMLTGQKIWNMQCNFPNIEKKKKSLKMIQN